MIMIIIINFILDYAYSFCQLFYIIFVVVLVYYCRHFNSNRI